MLRTISCIACFLVYVVDTYAQNEVSVRGDFAPPDTFALYTFQSVKPFLTLDSIGGKTVDTLSDPAAFIIDVSETSLDYPWCIAVKSKSSFVVIDPFENISEHPFYSQCVVSRLQFDGKGNDEVIIEWTYSWSHHAYSYGLDAFAAGVLIINIDNFSRIMNYQNFYSHDQWQDSTGPDTTDTLGDMVTTTIEDHAYENYHVSISKKNVIIIQECHPPEPSDEENSPQEYYCDKNVYNYKLTKKGLTRKK